MAELSPSQRQERRIARRFGGTVNAGSGNGWLRKADVRSKRFLFEAKRTGKLTLTVSFKVLRTLAAQAAAEGLMPVLPFELGGHNYVILTEDDFGELAGVESQ